MPFGDTKRPKIKGLHQARLIAQQHEHLNALMVASKLLGQGHTFDDEVTGRRWVFNKFGEVIGCSTKEQITETTLYAGYERRYWGSFREPVMACHLNIGAPAGSPTGRLITRDELNDPR